MDCKREAESELRLYNVRKLSIVSLEGKISELDARIDLATDNMQESYRYRKRKMEAQLSWLKRWLKGMDVCLGALPEEDRAVLDAFYINRGKDSIPRLMKKLGVCLSSVYRYRETAITRFATVMYGGVQI